MRITVKIKKLQNTYAVILLVAGQRFLFNTRLGKGNYAAQNSSESVNSIRIRLLASGILFEKLVKSGVIS